MHGDAPKQQTSPEFKRIDGPPKLPTKVTLDLDELGEPPPEDPPFLEMLKAIKNANQTWRELMLLNGGGRRLKQESLELSLDRNIVLLGRVLPKLESEDVEIVRSTLRRIRVYRRDFPRSEASNEKQARNAQRVLDDITEV